MPKQKTHSGAKKTFKIRKGGTVSRKKAGTLHNTGGKDSGFNRRSRKGATVSKSDLKRYKNII